MVFSLLLSVSALLISASCAFAAGGGVSDSQWADLGARVLNFAVLAIVLVVLLRKPLGKVFKSRTEGIAQELSELEAKRDEARKEFAEMERRMQDAQGEREKVLKGFREQGERERQQIIDNAHKMAQRIKEQAESAIEQETAAAKSVLRQEIADLSANLAEDLLKENINADDQTRLVDEYLVKVGQEIQ
jgi:F-type H+-transporting ATPase subunit b